MWAKERADFSFIYKSFSIMSYINELIILELIIIIFFYLTNKVFYFFFFFKAFHVYVCAYKHVRKRNWTKKEKMPWENI